MSSIIGLKYKTNLTWDIQIVVCISPYTCFRTVSLRTTMRMSQVVLFMSNKIQTVTIVIFTEVRSQNVCNQMDIWGKWIGVRHTNGRS